MKSAHILMETVCMAERPEDTAGCPCQGQQTMSIACLRDENHAFSPCRFFGCSKARSTVALTDADGSVMQASTFFGGLQISEQEYLAREQQWLSECSVRIGEL